MASSTSGVEKVTAQGRWDEASGAAEMDCHDKLNLKIEAAKERLEGDGKRVVGGTTSPLSSEEQTVAGRTRYRFSGTHELRWVLG